MGTESQRESSWRSSTSHLVTQGRSKTESVCGASSDFTHTGQRSHNRCKHVSSRHSAGLVLSILKVVLFLSSIGLLNTNLSCVGDNAKITHNTLNKLLHKVNTFTLSYKLYNNENLILKYSVTP